MAKEITHNDNYIKVKQRIIDLKSKGIWDNVSVNTEIIKDGYKKDVTGKDKMFVIVKATLTVTRKDAQFTYTGLSMEKEGEGEVNYLKFLENAETSAVGRALSFSGVEDTLNDKPKGEDVNIASEEEIQEAKDKNKDLAIEKKKQQSINLIKEALSKKVTSVEVKEKKEYNESNVPIFKGVPKGAKTRLPEHRKEIINYLQKEGLLKENNPVDALINSGLSVKYKKVDDLIKTGDQGELIIFIQNIKQS